MNSIGTMAQTAGRKQSVATEVWGDRLFTPPGLVLAFAQGAALLSFMPGSFLVR